MTADGHRYERIYSAAAAMLDAQGPLTGAVAWPAERRHRWNALATLLSSPFPAGSGPDGAPVADPARHLVSRRDRTGRPIVLTDAGADWACRLDAAGTVGDPDRPVVAVPGLLHLIADQLIDELVERLRPGRPSGAVGPDGADLSRYAGELTEQFRVAAGQSPPPDPPTLRASVPPADVEPPDPERLAAAARAAAASVPTPTELIASGDYTVRHAASVAAAELLAGLDDPAGPSWHERHEHIRPDRHLVSTYRVARPAGVGPADDGGPIGLAERAVEFRRLSGPLRPPWRPDADDPVPPSTPDQRWILLPVPAALITAELLDELAARLSPGRWIGTVRYPGAGLRELVGERLRATATVAAGA